METAIEEIVARLKASPDDPSQEWLDKLLRRRNRAAHDPARTVAKKRLLPFYLQAKAERPDQWRSWGIDDATEERLLRLLRAKPRRTASGVATITVLTKPHPCSSDCAYCPSDVRMPKSYLADEPACQRAERCFFDPYLQVALRLRALTAMGHATDKVELIVLGGTWSDYGEGYQAWFMAELFRALNDAGTLGIGSPAALQQAAEREASYRRAGIANGREQLAEATAEAQRQVDAGALGYNQAVAQLYGQPGCGWQQAAAFQHATLADVEAQHCANEQATHRCVGLVIETRPDLVMPESLALMRRMGCTKVQMGIQSLDEAVLARNGRGIGRATIARAFRLLRAYGFKVHVHFMVNLLGATPATDRADYVRLVTEAPFQPDEVKLYPCALVASSRLMAAYRAGDWVPYGEDELTAVLADDVRATPCFTRISRMIRDISAHDIVAGSKKANLRQAVEARLAAEGATVREIRCREIATDDVDAAQLALREHAYATEGTSERFLEWVTPEGRIAGFLRLSLPERTVEQEALSPCAPGEAMIREVHVYGTAARLGKAGEGAQHQGLGRQLVERACAIAAAEGYRAANVISAVGTREYYRRLGFEDAGLYQRRAL